MKINSDLINKIYNNDPKKRLKLKNKKDKEELSNYEEYIPMYDIYSDKIHPISKENLYRRLTDHHYRFINQEIKDWISNKYIKNKEGQQYNMDIISNYIIEILEKTSTKVLYKSSYELGLSISICKRNSFNKFAKHLQPYYSKEELIKLGQNMGVIDNISKIDINDKKTHYKICKKISKNDISYKEINSHNDYIVNNNLISIICNYSFMGSYFMNKYLRDDKDNNELTIKMINKLSRYLINTPPLLNDYYLYRFIWDDYFIKDLKKGDIFTDKGFISSTRDPFYSPGLKSNFGLILIKIKIPKNKNVGLLIENYSLFPKEEEFLLPPNSKLKLLSRDDKFTYYHTNKTFQNFISKKYEFEYIETKFNEILINPAINFKNLENFNSNAKSKINIIRQFIDFFQEKEYQLNITFNERQYKVFYNWFDGTDSYSKFYYNDNKDGMLFMIYDDLFYPYLSIELGNSMVINYISQFYYGEKEKEIDELDFKFIMDLAKRLNYQSFNLFLEFDNFSKFKSEKFVDNASYQYSNIYCKSIYKYLKDNSEFYDFIKKLDVKYKNSISYPFGYWKIAKLNKTKIKKEILDRYSTLVNKNDSISDLIIKIIENHFYEYPNISQFLNISDIPNPFIDPYLTINVLKVYYDDANLRINLPYSESIVENDDNFK